MTIRNNPSTQDEHTSSGNFSGQRVLLAEDSKINQQIAFELLSNVGLQVDIANNGEEALELLEKNVYSVVLMDLQMPVMDGYQATQRIRQNPQFSNLPIIAMTADASAAEREKCLALGMNDHIVKSLDPGYLYQALNKWILHAAPDNAIKVLNPNKQASPTDFPQDIPGIDLTQALQSVGGNAKLLKKLLLEFLHDHAGDDHLIAQALADGDTLKARRIAHTLQGISGSLGMNGVCAIAAALENALRSDEMDFCTLLLEALNAPLEEVNVALREFAKSSSSAVSANTSGKLLDIERCLIIIEAIGNAIDEMSPDAESKAEDLLDEMAGSQEKARAELLLAQLTEFDFDNASQTLKRLTDALLASR